LLRADSGGDGGSDPSEGDEAAPLPVTGSAEVVGGGESITVASFLSGCRSSMRAGGALSCAR